MANLENGDAPPQKSAQHADAGNNLVREAYEQQPERNSVNQPGENKLATTAPDAANDAAKNKALGLPNLELFGDMNAAKPGAQEGAKEASKDSNPRSFMDSAKDTLTNPNASMSDKLKTVSELGQKGIDKIQLADSDGKMRDYNVQVSNAGDRKMVNLFGKDDDGRSRVVLRGIQEGNGEISAQKDRSGNSVSFTGQHRSFFDRSTVDNAGPAKASAEQKGIAPQPRAAERAPEQRAPQPQPRAVESAPEQKAPQTQPRAAESAPEQKPQAPKVEKPEVKAPEAPKAVDRSELPPGRVNRSQFDKELQDPKVKAAFAGRMHSEVGSQGPAAQVAFAEEVMNRAAARNQTLMQALSGSYYPTSRPGQSGNPGYHQAIDKAWKEGSDTIHGATGNASGKVGFGVKGGRHDADGKWVSPNQTANIGGERFGYEQQDIKRGWLAKYSQLKGQPSDTALANR